MAIRRSTSSGPVLGSAVSSSPSSATSCAGGTVVDSSTATAASVVDVASVVVLDAAVSLVEVASEVVLDAAASLVEVASEVEGASVEASTPEGVNGFGIGFGPSAAEAAAREAAAAQAEARAAAEKKEAQRRKKAAKQSRRARLKHNDPALCAYARELRDRWQEHVAADPGVIGLGCRGKYDVGRVLGGGGERGGSEAVTGQALRVVAAQELKGLPDAA